MATTPDPERSARAKKAAATRAAKKAAAAQQSAAAAAEEQAGTGADAPAGTLEAVVDGAEAVVEVAVVDEPASPDSVDVAAVGVPSEVPAEVTAVADAPAEVPVKRAPRARAARARKATAPTAPTAAETPAEVPIEAPDETPAADVDAVEPTAEPAEAGTVEAGTTEADTTEAGTAEAAPARTAARRAPARVGPPKLDPMGAKAVEEARAAAVEVAGPGEVGEHLGVSAEADRVTVHRFATTHPGYRGWAWTVVLARIPRARAVTVSEVVLLPGEQALLAPSWVPWADRVEPGDLGETDVLPYRDQDPLLDEGLEQVPDGFDLAFSGDEVALTWELGLGRRRVLNREGRIEAATRWYRSDNGPDNAETRAADAPCSTCGYLVGMTGTFRQSFGVCANAWSPDDGRVVSMDHGCGAHSETGQTAEEPDDLPEPLIDDLRQELDTDPLPGEAAEPVSSEGVRPG
ncbi:DUF3027 domain-containing protein [Jannaschia sp. R86511]|uniref:DUF3027 domain-containing protein n=1 Tax=Jannaschia sp. R86511 TaxID=3093853 RepID=UPI0036D2BC6D